MLKGHSNQWYWKCRKNCPPPYYVWNAGQLLYRWLFPWWSDWVELTSFWLSPEWFDFPKDKLYMTYYPDDKDSYNRWIAMGVEPSVIWFRLRIISGNRCRTFWAGYRDFLWPGWGFWSRKYRSPSLRRRCWKRSLYRNLEYRLVTIQHQTLLYRVAVQDYHIRTLIRAQGWSVWSQLSRG